MSLLDFSPRIPLGTFSILLDLICFIFYRKNTKLVGNAHVHRNYDTVRYDTVELKLNR